MYERRAGPSRSETVVPYKHIGKNIVILTKISPATINVHKIPYERSSAVVNLSVVGVDVPGDPIKVGFAPKRTAREVGPYNTYRYDLTE